MNIFCAMFGHKAYVPPGLGPDTSFIMYSSKATPDAASVDRCVIQPCVRCRLIYWVPADAAEKQP